MTKTSAPPTTGLAAMEGGGFYNKHSSMQAAGNASLLPHWAKMVREVALDGTPIVVADYGSSQGRNSMAPMRMAIEGISARTGAATPIQIVHTDLPTNDFAVLFSELSEPSSYMAGVPDVYPSAIGRSYFEQILPANSVHLGWNTWTLHWLSGEPIDAPDHAYVMLSQDTNVLARLKQRQADDWRCFLQCRARELKSGGQLLTAFTGMIDGKMGLEIVNSAIWAAVQDLGREGVLSDAEQLRMTMPIAARFIEDIHAPFAESGTFAGLKVEMVEIVKVPDPAWIAYQATGDAAQFGRDHANTKRAYAAPTIAGFLGTRTDKAVVLDRLFDRFALRIAAAPQPHECNLAIVVLRKVA